MKFSTYKFNFSILTIVNKKFVINSVFGNYCESFSKTFKLITYKYKAGAFLIKGQWPTTFCRIYYFIFNLVVFT